MRSVFRRRYRFLPAIEEIDVNAWPGEILSILGPNGAGKTTLLKCVAGLLTPTGGEVRVLGFRPSSRDRRYLRQLGFVMGQRWQLHPDIPVAESFAVSRTIFGLSHSDYRSSRDQLVELLDLGHLLSQIALELSLGQRMRCEFAAALLHQPGIVLLDEPTLGLDFAAQQQIRTFVRNYATLRSATCC